MSKWVRKEEVVNRGRIARPGTTGKPERNRKSRESGKMKKKVGESEKDSMIGSALPSANDATRRATYAC